MTDAQFADRLLAWFDRFGRHDLPWQSDPSPYRVWISEIMLQQTQVVTVIPYYQRFLERFPDIKQLATADLDAVLHYWSGLGYYTRARNIHKAANIIMENYAAQFPSTYTEVITLPGIGRSTAGAILTLAFGQRYPILDGNVKRVLSRYHALEGYVGSKVVETQLWDYADQHMPQTSMDIYTQAIMDLGATVCTRRNPKCHFCPLQDCCIAHSIGRQHDFPNLKRRAIPPQRDAIFVIIENKAGEILLEKRPPVGIWGGLWSFPEIPTDSSIEAVIQDKYGYRIKQQREYKSFKHKFSHFHLLIKPVHIMVEYQASRINESQMMTWINLDIPYSNLNLGFPAPVVSLLEDLTNRKKVSSV